MLVALGALLATGCTPAAEPPVQTATATAAPTRTTAAAPVFGAAVEVLTAALVPDADVHTCGAAAVAAPSTGLGETPAADLTPRLPRAGAKDTVTVDGAAAATVIPTCGSLDVETVRAAGVTGFAHGPDEPVQLPVAGGAARVVEVYDFADPEAAAATFARYVADPDGWAADQVLPEVALGDGTYQPRRVVTGARVAVADLPGGWGATVLSRDEAGVARDGQPSSQVSYAYLWAVNGRLLLRVQVAGDEPGAAARTATRTARELVGTLAGDVG